MVRYENLFCCMAGVRSRVLVVHTLHIVCFWSMGVRMNMNRLLCAAEMVRAVLGAALCVTGGVLASAAEAVTSAEVVSRSPVLKGAS